MKLLARYMLARRVLSEISSIPSSSLSGVAVRLAVIQLLLGGGNAGLICQSRGASQRVSFVSTIELGRARLTIALETRQRPWV